MADQFKNVMIGLFVTAATLIVIFILMFLHPRIGDEGKLLHVRFTDIDKITLGTRVTYAGRPVGEVVGIQEIEEGRSGKTDSNGHLYIYELTLRVDTGVNVFNTDEISSRTSGLLGEKNVEITPIAPQPGQSLIKLDKEQIYAQETGSVEETLKEFRKVANKFDSALDAATRTINRINDQHLVDNISHTIENIHSITNSLNKPKELSETLDNLHRFSERVNASWTTIDKTLDSINAASESAQKFLNHGQIIVEGISRGEGSLGKLLSNDEIYLRVSSIMSKLETILDDVNHYGLLFQSDKGWQRLRARRLNLLQKLSTPQEFRNYFNDEVDQISTSLSRVYMVLNEVSNDQSCCNLLQDREFNKVFSELMRRVTMLEEEIRMYNTQAVEAQVHTTELGNPCNTQVYEP